TLPMVLKALNAVQWPNHPIGGPAFAATECDQLTQIGLWVGNQVIGDIHRRVVNTLYNALIADFEAARALGTVRDNATTQGQAICYQFHFPPEAISLAALPWEVLWDDREALLLSRGKPALCIRYLDLPQALPPDLPF